MRKNTVRIFAAVSVVLLVAVNVIAFPVPAW